MWLVSEVAVKSCSNCYSQLPAYILTETIFHVPESNLPENIGCNTWESDILSSTHVLGCFQDNLYHNFWIDRKNIWNIMTYCEVFYDIAVK